MARISLSILILLGLQAFPQSTPVKGQTIPSPFRFVETRQEAGLFAGFSTPGTGRFGFGPGSGVLLGARYAIRLSGPLAAEAVLGYLASTRDVIDPRRVEGSRVVGDAGAAIVTLDGRLRFSLTGDRTWHGLNPFLLVGGGVAFDAAGKDASDAILESDDRFEFRTTPTGIFGGGMRWFVSDRLLIRSDLSLGIWRLRTPRGYLDPDRDLTGVGKKEWVSGPTFSLGAAIHY